MTDPLDLLADSLAEPPQAASSSAPDTSKTGVTVYPIPTARAARPKREELPALARSYAERYGVDPDIFERQIKQESGFNQFARSPKGALGLSQFMPATGRQYGLVKSSDFLNAEKSLDAGARYHSDLLKKYNGNQDLVLAAYNAGEGAVDDYLNGTNLTGKNPRLRKTGGIPPFRETQNYIKAIRGASAKSRDNIPSGIPASGDHLDVLADLVSAPPAATAAKSTPSPVASAGDHLDSLADLVAGGQQLQPPVATPELTAVAPTAPTGTAFPAEMTLGAVQPPQSPARQPQSAQPGMYDLLSEALGLAPHQQNAKSAFTAPVSGENQADIAPPFDAQIPSQVDAAQPPVPVAHYQQMPAQGRRAAQTSGAATSLTPEESDFVRRSAKENRVDENQALAWADENKRATGQPLKRDIAPAVGIEGKSAEPIVEDITPEQARRQAGGTVSGMESRRILKLGDKDVPPAEPVNYHEGNLPEGVSVARLAAPGQAPASSTRLLTIGVSDLLPKAGERLAAKRQQEIAEEIRKRTVAEVGRAAGLDAEDVARFETQIGRQVVGGFGEPGAELSPAELIKRAQDNNGVFETTIPQSTVQHLAERAKPAAPPPASAVYDAQAAERDQNSPAAQVLRKVFVNKPAADIAAGTVSGVGSLVRTLGNVSRLLDFAASGGGIGNVTALASDRTAAGRSAQDAYESLGSLAERTLEEYHAGQTPAEKVLKGLSSAAITTAPTLAASGLAGKALSFAVTKELASAGLSEFWATAIPEMAGFGAVGGTEALHAGPQAAGRAAVQNALLIPIYKAAGLIANRPLRVAAAGTVGGASAAAFGGDVAEVIQSAIIGGALSYPGGSKSPFALDPEKPPSYVRPVLEETADYLVKKYGMTPEQAAEAVSRSWVEQVKRAEAEGLDPREVRKRMRDFVKQYGEKPAEGVKQAEPAGREPFDAGSEEEPPAAPVVDVKPEPKTPRGGGGEEMQVAEGDKTAKPVIEEPSPVSISTTKGEETNAREGTAPIQREAGPSSEAYSPERRAEGRAADTGQVNRLRDRQQAEEFAAKPEEALAPVEKPPVREATTEKPRFETYEAGDRVQHPDLAAGKPLKVIAVSSNGRNLVLKRDDGKGKPIRLLADSPTAKGFERVAEAGALPIEKPAHAQSALPTSRVNLLNAPQGKPASSGVKRLIEEKRRIEAEAATDKLTGLQNQNQWKAAQPRIDADPNLHIARLDINHLKAVNDTHGHEAGDAYIEQAGKIIGEEATKAGVSPRMQFRSGTGDEFTLAGDQKAVTEAAKAIQTRIASEVKLLDGSTGSIAYGVAPREKAADALMYANKKAMKAAVFTETTKTAPIAKKETANRTAGAISSPQDPRGGILASATPAERLAISRLRNIRASQKPNAQGELYISPQINVEVKGKSRLVNISGLVDLAGLEPVEGKSNYYRATAEPAGPIEEKPAESGPPAKRPTRADAIRLAQEAAARKIEKREETKRQAQEKIEAAKEKRTPTLESFTEDTKLLPYQIAEDILRSRGITDPSMVDYVGRKTLAVYGQNEQFRKNVNKQSGREFYRQFVEHWIEGESKRREKLKSIAENPASNESPKKATATPEGNISPPAKRRPSRVTKSPTAESRRKLVESLNDDDLWDEPGQASLTPRGWRIADTTLKDARESDQALFSLDGDYLAANAAAVQMLSRAYGKTVRGVTFTAPQAKGIAAKAAALAAKATAPVERNNLRALAMALIDAARNNEEFGIGRPRSLFHEVGHVAQLALRRFFGRDITPEDAEALPEYRTGEKGLNAKGYTWLADPRVIAHEVYAHIAGGQWAEIGMNIAQAARFVEGYYKLIAKTYRADALKRFNRLDRFMENLHARVYEETRRAEAGQHAGAATGVIQGGAGRQVGDYQTPDEAAADREAREDLTRQTERAARIEKHLLKNWGLVKPDEAAGSNRGHWILADGRITGAIFHPSSSLGALRASGVAVGNIEPTGLLQMLSGAMRLNTQEGRVLIEAYGLPSDAQFRAINAVLKAAGPNVWFAYDLYSPETGNYISTGDSLANLRREAETLEGPLADLSAIPLPPRVVSALVEITKSFIKSGESDFDVLMNEIEGTVSAERFDQVKPYLADIFNAAYDRIEGVAHEATTTQSQAAGARSVQGSQAAEDASPKNTETAKTQVAENQVAAEAPKVTGTKQETTAAEREARGLSPVEKQAYTGMGEAFLAGKRAVESGAIDPRALAAEISKKPRPLSSTEVGALGYHRTQLMNEHADAIAQIAKAIDGQDAAFEISQRARVSRIEEDFAANDEALQKGGREQSAAFNARKMMIAEDYSLVAVVNRMTAAKGEPLTSEERARLERLVTEENQAAKDLQKRLDAAEAEIKKLKAARAVKEMRPAGKARPKEKLDAEVKSLVGELAKLSTASESQPMADLASRFISVKPEGIKAGDYIRSRTDATVHGITGRVLSVGRRNVKVETEAQFAPGGPIYRQEHVIAKGDVIEAKRRNEESEPFADLAPPEEPLTPDHPEVARIIKALARNRVEAGLNTAEAVTDAIHDLIKEHIPGITKRDVANLWSGAARPAQHTKGELALRLAEVRRQQKLLSEIEDAERGVAPQGGKAPSRQASQRVGGLRKQLDDILRQQGLKTDRQQSPEARLKAAKTRLTKELEQLRADLKAGNYAKAKREAPTLAYDKEANDLRAARDTARDEIEQIRIRMERQNRSGGQKFLDAAVGWRRAILLSSIQTLAKLTAAATARNITTPIEEAIGTGLRVIPGVRAISKRAPRHGRGFNPKAEAAALMTIVNKALYGPEGKITEAAIRTLKTGRTKLDIVYGGKKVALDPEFIDWFAHMHGALKTQPKIAEFQRSFVQNMDWAYNETIRKGATPEEAQALIASPDMQMEIGMRAYPDANRAILMQDNAAVTLFQMINGWLSNRGPAGKLASAGLRFVFPIVKVGTNYVIETSDIIAGGPKGLARLIYAGAFGGGSGKGGGGGGFKPPGGGRWSDNLSPDDADYIMRVWKKQGFGFGLMALGWLAYGLVGGMFQQGEKRKKEDVPVGKIRIHIFGLQFDAPKYLAHNPALEAVQLAATLHRLYDRLHEKSESKWEAGSEAATETAKSMVEEVPFIGEPMRMAKQSESPSFVGRWFGENAKEMIVPPDVERAAKAFDPAEPGGFIESLKRFSGFKQPEVKRKPEGVKETLEAAVPGLRKKVPLVRGVPEDVGKELQSADKPLGKPKRKEDENLKDYNARVEKGNEQITLDVRTLATTDEFKNATRDERRRMLKEAIQHARKQSGEKVQESDAEHELWQQKAFVHDKILESVKARDAFKALSKEGQESVTRGVSMLLERFDITTRDRKALDDGQRSEKARILIERLHERGAFDQEIERLILRAQRKAA